MHLPTLLTPAEAATYLKLSTSTLENLRSLGQGPAYVKLPNQRIRYRASDLALWSGAAR